jgi:histidinol phosphatase-like enzyme (inositol monophosphatase family)
MAVSPDDIALIQHLADAAGGVIRPHFRRQIAVETKGDASPVTLADQAAETAIRQLLDAHRPHDGVIGEEHESTNAGAARLWVIDPIDGTRAFISGRPLFGTLIALMEDGVPVLGIIDQCIIGDRWLGVAGQPTTFNGQPIHTRRCASLAHARIGTTSPHAFEPADLTAFTRVQQAALDTLYGGDCHNYGLVASGHLDAVVEASLKLHDWAALVPVIEGAGGAITDWEGAPLTQSSTGRVIATGDKTLAPKIAAKLQGSEA